DELLDSAAVALDEVAGELEVTAQELAGLLRIATRRDCRPRHEVSEQDRDESSFRDRSAGGVGRAPFRRDRAERCPSRIRKGCRHTRLNGEPRRREASRGVDWPGLSRRPPTLEAPTGGRAAWASSARARALGRPRARRVQRPAGPRGPAPATPTLAHTRGRSH